MKTSNPRIHDLLTALYYGPNWVSVDILSTLEPLDAAKAGKRVLPQSNTIWEIVNHMIEWRINILGRLHGEEIPSPSDNYIQKVTDQSDIAWKNTLTRFEKTQMDWMQFLKEFGEHDFSKEYEPSGATYYEFVHGIIQHDYYHLGQIKMIVKYV